MPTEFIRACEWVDQMNELNSALLLAACAAVAILICAALDYCADD